MKRMGMLSSALLMFLATRVACADPGDIRFGVQAGPSFPTRLLADATAPGYAGGFVLQYMGDSRSGVGVEVARHNWGDRSPVQPSLLTLFDPDARVRLNGVVATFHVVVEGTPSRRVTPFGEVGYAICWMRGDLRLFREWSLGDWEMQPGFAVNGGVRWRVAPDACVSLSASYLTTENGSHWSAIVEPRLTVMKRWATRRGSATGGIAHE